MKYILNPVGLGAEHLQPMHINTTDDQTLILGRNVATGLDQPSYNNVQFISRNHALVVVENGGVFLQADPKQAGTVFLNNKVCGKKRKALEFGDMFSLLGSLNYYNYELIEDSSEDVVVEIEAPVVEEEKVTQPPKVDQTKEIMSKLLRQYECSICYETMACSFSLSPCGDSFCYVCIADWAKKHDKCPMCNIPFHIKSSMTSKLADNAIREILSMDTELLEEWEGRTKLGLDSWKEQLQK